MVTHGSGLSFTSWLGLMAVNGIDCGDRCHSQFMFARLVVICGMICKNTLFEHIKKSSIISHGADLWTTKDGYHYTIQWIGLFINEQWCKKFLGLCKMRESTG